MSSRHQRPTRRRFLSMETLEERRLLIAGVPFDEVPPQNYANPEDANYDGSVTPVDALLVINELNNQSQGGSPSSFSKDIDGDGVVTPRDALLVINRLNSQRDTSSVPPEQRAIGLRKALDAGYSLPNMSLSEAQELLETLENGGRYEAGERYRNGQMINVNDPQDPIGGAVAEAEASSVMEQSVPAVEDALLPGTSSSDPIEENDPLALLQSADEALAEHLHDETLWRRFAASYDAENLELVDQYATRFARQLVDRYSSEESRERLAQLIADAIDHGDETVEDILVDLQALRATLGDAHSQISQLFANLDVVAIVEQLGVDLGTLAEAVLAHDLSEPTEREVMIADFLSREYLNGLLDDSF